MIAISFIPIVNKRSRKKNGCNKRDVPILFYITWGAIGGVFFINALIMTFKRVNIQLKSDLDWANTISLLISVGCAIVIAYSQFRINKTINAKREAQIVDEDKAVFRKEIIQWFASAKAVGLSGNIGYNFFPFRFKMDTGYYYIQITNDNGMVLLPYQKGAFNCNVEDALTNQFGLVIKIESGKGDSYDNLFTNVLHYDCNRNDNKAEFELYFDSIKGLKSEKKYRITVSAALMAVSGFNNECVLPLWITLNTINIEETT